MILVIDQSVARKKYNKDYLQKLIKKYNDLLGFDGVIRMSLEFEDRDASLVGVSIDTSFVHLAWRQQNELLNKLPFPMLSDVKRELSTELGILDEAEGVAQRATFIIDPHNIIQHITVNNLNVGRNPNETLRILDALQTDELCPCNRPVGGDTI